MSTAVNVGLGAVIIFGVGFVAVATLSSPSDKGCAEAKSIAAVAKMTKAADGSITLSFDEVGVPVMKRLPNGVVEFECPSGLVSSVGSNLAVAGCALPERPEPLPRSEAL